MKELTTGVHSGWLKMSYARMMAEKGLPYFTDTESARAGEWVRIVLVTDAGESHAWWCVGKLNSWTEDEIVFEELKYENGDCPPELEDVRLSGRARYVVEDGAESWLLTELERESSS